MGKALVNQAMDLPKATRVVLLKFHLLGLLVGTIEINAGSLSMNRPANGPLNTLNSERSTTRSDARKPSSLVERSNARFLQGGPSAQAGYYQSGSTLGGGQYYEEKHESRGHGAAYGAMGAAAGLAGGALLMHEGEKVEQDWDQDKARVENRLEGGVQDVENFPENAARWTGEKVSQSMNELVTIGTKWIPTGSRCRRYPSRHRTRL